MSELIYSISTITLFELHCGQLKRGRSSCWRKLPKLPFDERCARTAGRIFRGLRRQGKIPPAKDLLIAATVVAHDKVLITLDRDFLLFKDYGLKVELLSG